jgi:hypothetical protein
MRTWRRQLALAIALAFTAGCASLHPNTCKVLWATIPAALGGVGGGLIGSRVVNHGADESAGSENWEIAASTAIGVVSGGLVGLLLGHFICVEEAPPPPPPPPPARVAPPPPPPPPPTERRGG